MGSSYYKYIDNDIITIAKSSRYPHNRVEYINVNNEVNLSDYVRLVYYL